MFYVFGMDRVKMKYDPFSSPMMFSDPKSYENPSKEPEKYQVLQNYDDDGDSEHVVTVGAVGLATTQLARLPTAPPARRAVLSSHPTSSSLRFSQK